jgi:hypothetical protein
MIYSRHRHNFFCLFQTNETEKQMQPSGLFIRLYKKNILIDR